MSSKGTRAEDSPAALDWVPSPRDGATVSTVWPCHQPSQNKWPAGTKPAGRTGDSLSDARRVAEGDPLPWSGRAFQLPDAGLEPLDLPGVDLHDEDAHQNEPGQRRVKESGVLVAVDYWLAGWRHGFVSATVPTNAADFAARRVVTRLGAAVVAAPNPTRRTTMHAFTFTNIPKAEIEAHLGAQGFTPIEIKGTHELVYRRIVEVNGNVFSLRVYTSLNPDGTTRPAGSDAIRTQLWAIDADGHQIKLKGAKRTMRVLTWAKNLQRKIEQLTTFAHNIPADTYPKHAKKPVIAPVQSQPTPCCPKCKGGLTPPKMGRNGLFRGCLAFPRCRGGVNVS